MEKIEIEFKNDRIVGTIWSGRYRFFDEYEIGTNVHEIIDELFDGMKEAKKL